VPVVEERIQRIAAGDQHVGDLAMRAQVIHKNRASRSANFRSGSPTNCGRGNATGCSVDVEPRS
jgi:hypothetical protein